MQHNNPLPTEILNLLPTLTPLQLAWLSGYAWSQASGVEQQVAGQHLAANLTALSAEPFSITVLSGSQTGNAKDVYKRQVITEESKNEKNRFIFSAFFRLGCLFMAYQYGTKNSTTECVL